MAKQIFCENCELEIDGNSDFCPRCGTLLNEGVKCTNHPTDDADYVCVICSEPFCKRCGTILSGIFFCPQHDGYEVYEGMARVYGSSDEAQVNYFKDCLEQESLHPFIYSRKSSPLNIDGSDNLLFLSVSDLDGHIFNETKLMVPCSEVLEAEKIIKEIELSEP